MNINLQLERIETRIEELIRSQFANDNYQNLTSTCDQVLQTVILQAMLSSQGGKRLRALLTLAAYQAYSETDISQQHSERTDKSINPEQSVALDIACALEVFQSAALIHDDIIDESTLRRGRPSAYCALSQACHNKHIGSGLGVMLGDLLATGSFEMIRHSSEPLAQSHNLLAAFARMQHDVSVGQVLDLSIELMPLDNPDELRNASFNVFKWKTASYTTIAPLELGFLAAGMNATQARTLAQRIGEPLGIAFQLADDLIDIVADSVHSGKPIGGDIREGKRAVLLADALTLATATDQAFLRQSYALEERSANTIADIIAIYHACGAIQQSKQRICKLYAQSQEAISNTDLPTQAKQHLYEITARFIPCQWQE